MGIKGRNGLKTYAENASVDCSASDTNVDSLVYFVWTMHRQASGPFSQ